MLIIGIIGTVLCLLSAATAVYWGTRVVFNVYQWNNRIDALEASMKTLKGKVYADERWEREAIEEAVDRYLERTDRQGGGEMGADSMMQMLAMMQGMGPTPSRWSQPEPEPEPRRRPGVIGSGGVDTDEAKS